MKVILYSTPTCGMCSVLKSKLEEKNIDFMDIEKLSILQEKGITHVPVLEVDETQMNFKEALDWLQEV